MTLPTPIAPTLDGAHVLILGGTGSLGQRLFHRILAGKAGTPASVTVLSRDEAKQHYMRLDTMHLVAATDEVIYGENAKRVRFVLGDVRRLEDMRRAVDRADVIFHAAAYKQVPACEYFAGAAVDTNIYGALHLVQALREGIRGPKAVIGISTDKACKPVNVMGMTKALQERVLLQANLDAHWVRFVNVRYGNVMASRGSAIPFFVQQARARKALPITDQRMTRFLMTLDQSVDLILAALKSAQPGETFLPVVPTAKVVDIARAVAEDPNWPLEFTGIRPGEKLHEILISEEEAPRLGRDGANLVILPVLPELRSARPLSTDLPLDASGEFSSAAGLLDLAQVRELLARHKLTVSTAPTGQEIYQ